MKLWLKLLIGIPLALVVIALLVLGYLGFVPGLSSLMGASTPRDLGVHYTAQDVESFHAKTGIDYTTISSDAAPKDSLKLTGSKPVNGTMTSEEMTAMVNDIDSKWKYYPVSNTQIKISDDGTVEMSGILDMDVLNEYAEATNMPESYREVINNYSGLFPTNPRFYVKTNGYIEDGNVNGDELEVEIGRVQIPQDVLDNNMEAIQSFVEERLLAEGVDANSASFDGGKLTFNGSIPAEVGLSPP